MNEFNRSYVYRSTETERKGRKEKKNREEVCKCFPPFLKLHYHDCPVVTKPCPIHGNCLRDTEKETKVDREQNVIISFHPSSKTERLLQPIKSLLAHCNSETKINFQYYSPDNCISKESLKGQNGQKAYENLKRTLNSSIFVEKTKSFVANKTNKVKKLKQCFHSPCNSIAQKTRSQTSIKEKINQILREEAKQTRTAFYNMVPEIPPDDKKCDPVSKWFSSNKGDFKKNDALSEEKLDSDYITVTQQDKNNAIHHKIFEIKHRKGVSDIPFTGFSKQPTQLVYSTINVTAGQNQTTEYKYERKTSVKEEEDEKVKRIEVSSSERTHRSFTSSSTSSGSVYITPFIFLPKGMEDSDIESKSKIRNTVDQSEQAIQVEDLITPIEWSPKGTQTSPLHSEGSLCPPKEWSPKGTQTSPLHSEGSLCPPKEWSPKGTQTSPEHSEKTLIPVESRKPSPIEEPFKSVSLQTDTYLQDRICPSSRHVYVHDYEPCTTRMEEICISNELVRRNIDDNCSQNRRTEVTGRITDSYRNTRAVGTCCPYREVLITAHWNNGMRDQVSQTDEPWSVQVSVRTFESRTRNKSQTMLPEFTSTGIQAGSVKNVIENTDFKRLTSPQITFVKKPSDQQKSDRTIDKSVSASGPQYAEREIATNTSANTPENSEFIHLNSPNVTYVIKPFDQQESDHDMEKLAKVWWGKSHSDSDLYERLKCDCCKVDNESPLVQPDFSKHFNNASHQKGAYTKIYESNSPFDSDKVNFPKTGNVTLRTKETVERFSDSKQTSTREEELSAAVSDLSELKKIIQEFFEKGSLSSKKSCICDKTVTKEKITDSDIPVPKREQKTKKSLISEAVQTPIQLLLELFPNIEKKKETFAREVQTAVDKTEKSTVEVQTSRENLERISTITQTVSEVKPKKNNAEVQKSFHESDGVEQDNVGHDNLNLRQTSVVDRENRTKTFFVCALCGREINNLVNTTTNTEVTRPNIERKEKPTVADAEYSESYEVKLRSKKVQSTNTYKRQFVDPARNTEQIENKNDIPKKMAQQDSPRTSNSQKSRIPVPSNHTYVRFKNNETLLCTESEYLGLNWRQHKTTTCHTHASQVIESTCRPCICDTLKGPSSTKGIGNSLAQNAPNTSKSKGTTMEPKPDAAPRREQNEQQNGQRSNQTNGRKTQKNNDNFILPVLVTPFWPKDLIKTWKSIKKSTNEILSNDESKTQISKQKRTYEKDLEKNAFGKKIKVDANEEIKKYAHCGEPELYDLLRDGKLGDFQIWPTAMMPYPSAEDERSSTPTNEASYEEAAVKLPHSPRETYPDNDDDVFPESEHYSDTNNTTRTTENSLLVEDDEEEQVGETGIEEPGEINFDSFSKLNLQNHSEVYSRPFYPDATKASKSLNAFYVFMNPKKYKKTFRKKHSN